MLENTKKVSSFLKRPWSNYALQNFKNIFFSVPARQRDNKPKCKYRYQTEKEQTKEFEFSHWNGQTIRKDGSFYPFLKPFQLRNHERQGKQKSKTYRWWNSTQNQWKLLWKE